METYLGNTISTYLNPAGYWVARVSDGPFTNLTSWQPSRRKSVRLLKTVLDKVMKNDNTHGG